MSVGMSIAPAVPSPRLVSDIMTTNVLTVDITDTLWDAWQMMFVSGHRHLAVMADNHCIGIINDRSILSSVIVTEARLAMHHVSDVMNRADVVSVTPATCVEDTATLMAEHKLNALPVIDADSKIRGIVTSTDLIRWIAGH